MPNVGHFHHLVMEVSDLDRSARFCEEIIGLEPVGRDLWPEDGSNVAFRTAEGQYFVLVEVPDFKPTLGVHTNFMLSTSDYEVVYERLKSVGALVIDHRAEQRSVGEVSTYFSDPDGQRLQITAFEPEAFHVPAAKRGKIVAGRLEDFPIGSVAHNRGQVLRRPFGRRHPRPERRLHASAVHRRVPAGTLPFLLCVSLQPVHPDR